MLRRLLLLLAPLAILLIVELAFALGLWESLAKPDSHAGTSVRLKQALLDPAFDRIDVVALGSSRPEYGIDHQRLAAEFHGKGKNYANLSMPGSHWSTVDVLSRWLERHHPEIGGGIIALSIQDFSLPYNGYYELGILQPFRELGDYSRIATRIPFNRNDLDSYAIFSSLFAWRNDLQDYLHHPIARKESLNWYAVNRPATYMLQHNSESSGDLCIFGTDSLAVCERIEHSADAAHASLGRQCKELHGMSGSRFDYLTAIRDGTFTIAMVDNRDLVRAQLSRMKWTTPPIVVLMPMPSLWKRDVLGPGLHEWARSILQPLADEGRIRLIDGTDQLAGENECEAFFDFYHQSTIGRDRFTEWLLPQIGFVTDHPRAPDTENPP